MSTSVPSSFQWKNGLPDLLAHSSVKHSLLRAYLRDYLSILINVPRRRELRLTLFDGFAGGGAFLHEGRTVPGTPLIMAEEVMHAVGVAAARGISLDIDLWAVEKDKQNFDELHFRLGEFAKANKFPGRIHVRNTGYDQVLSEALARIRSIRGTTGRSIFLLDQTGFGQVNFDHIQFIFQHLQRPEVLLIFSVSWLVDLASTDPAFLAKVASVGIAEQELAELLSAKNDWSPRYGGQRWIREYITRFIGAKHNTCFFLKSRPANKDLWLLHFANQWRARDAMMGVHYRFANEAHFYGKAGFEMLGFDPACDSSQMSFGFTAKDAEASVEALLEDIPRSLTDRGGADGISLEKLFDREVNDATVTFRMFEKGAVIARDNGLIEILTADGKPRPAARWLSKDDVIRRARQNSFWQVIGRP